MMAKSTTSTCQSSEPKVNPEKQASERVDMMHRDLGFRRRHLDAIKRGEFFGPGDAKFEELRPRARRDSLTVLLGDRGTGKSQIAARMAFHRKGNPGRYTTAVELFSAIKASFDGKGDTQSILKGYKSTRFLVIDEFNEALGTEWERQIMTDIIDYRYGEMLATVIIANLKPEEAKNALGRSICSRAQETGGFVLCDWPSYRSRKENKNGE